MKTKEYIKFVLKQDGQSPYKTKNGKKAKNFPQSASIPAEDVVRTEDGSVKRIKYSPSEDTIFVSDQVFKDSKVKEPEFVDGYLLVSPKDKNLLMFMRMCNWNGTNENRDKDKPVLFEEIDEAKIADKQLKKDMKIMDAQQLLYEIGDSKVKSIARAWLGGNIDVDSVTENYLRVALNRKIPSEPQKFIDMVSDPVIERVDVIMMAEENNVIRYSRNTWRYNDADGTPIVVVPGSKDRYSYLAELSIDELKREWSEISRLLEKTQKDVSEGKSVDPEKLTSEEASNIEEMTTLELFEELKKQKIIEWKAPNYITTQNGEEEILGRSGNDVVDLIQENADVSKNLKKRLAIAMRK